MHVPASPTLRDLPADRWAVVTSAQRDLALSRLTAAGLPIPTVLVTAEVPGDPERRRTWWCPRCQPGPGPDR